MKLQSKIVSIFLSVILCFSMLPVAGAAETVAFSLETVTAYDSLSAMMLLRVHKVFDTDVELTLSYDTSKVTLGPDEALVGGKIELVLSPDQYIEGMILGFFQFTLEEGVTEDVPIYLEAKTADGTVLSTKNGLICPTDTDYSVTAHENDKLIPMFYLGTALAAQDNITMGEARQILIPSSGCSLEGYSADGALLADSDRIGTCSFLSSSKDGAVVSQALFVMMGDVDGNGLANASDALLVLQHSVELIALNEFVALGADVDANGKIDASDALTILQYSVGLIPYCLPVS